MLLIRKIKSLLFYLKNEYRIVVFFTLFFSIVSLLLSVVISPLFTTTSRVLVSGGGSSILSSLASQLPFGISLGGSALTDELEMIASNDLKIEVFQQSDAKIFWSKVDEDIRHFVCFDSIPLTESPKKIKIEVRSKNSFDIFISKKYEGALKILEKMPFTTYEKYGEGVSGKSININKSFNMMITSNELEVGDEFVFEIGYKFPKFVMNGLFNKITFVNDGLTSIIDIVTTGGDPIKIVDLNLHFFESYIESRYKSVNDDKGEVLSIIDKKVAYTKARIDSLSLLQKELSMKYNIVVPEEEATELYKLYSSFFLAKQNLSKTEKLQKEFSPYDSIAILSTSTQIRLIDEELDGLKKTLYETYPKAIVDFFSVEYQLEAEVEILSELLVQKESASISEIMEIGNRKVIEKPSFPFSRTKPQRLKMLIQFFMIGMFIGVGYLYYQRYKNGKIQRAFEIGDGVVFTVGNSADDVKKEYISKLIAPIIDDNILVGYYKNEDENFTKTLKDCGINANLINNIMNQIPLTNKKSVAVLCKYDELSKKDIIKLEDKFDDRIVYIFFDIDFDKKNDYYYDKFIDDSFKEKSFKA